MKPSTPLKFETTATGHILHAKTPLTFPKILRECDQVTLAAHAAVFGIDGWKIPAGWNFRGKTGEFTTRHCRRDWLILAFMAVWPRKWEPGSKSMRNHLKRFVQGMANLGLCPDPDGKILWDAPKLVIHHARFGWRLEAGTTFEDSATLPIQSLAGHFRTCGAAKAAAEATGLECRMGAPLVSDLRPTPQKDKMRLRATARGLTDDKGTHFLCPDKTCTGFTNPGEIQCEQKCPYQAAKALVCFACGRVLILSASHSPICRVDCKCGASNFQRMSGIYNRVNLQPDNAED